MLHFLIYYNVTSLPDNRLLFYYKQGLQLLQFLLRYSQAMSYNYPAMTYFIQGTYLEVLIILLNKTLNTHYLYITKDSLNTLCYFYTIHICSYSKEFTLSQYTRSSFSYPFIQFLTSKIYFNKSKASANVTLLSITCLYDSL